MAPPANSVGTKQLKQGAIIAAKIKPHSLLAENFKDGQLPVGPQGPAGATGLTGAAGANATKLFATVLPNAGGVTLGPSSGIAPNAVALLADGEYLLSFAQDVSKRAVIAAPGGKPTDNTTVGIASAQTLGAGAVRVQTFGTDGFPTTLGSVTVAVLC